MKQILNNVLECLRLFLPFLRKKNPKELKEFTDLVKDQYEFLIDQLEKVLRDYFELSAKVTEMHTEILSLKTQLAKSLVERCGIKDCTQRE